MSWAGIANNQTVSFNNLQNAVSTGVFTALASIPASNEQITKADASTYVNVYTSYAPFAAKTSNQLVVKSDLVEGFTIYGAGYGCVVPETDILIAPEITRKADNFQVGDTVYTQHETTKVWGYYKVAALERKEQPILNISTDKGGIRCSTTHFLFRDDKFVKAEELIVGDIISHIEGAATITDIVSEDVSTVIDFTIEDAHTYVAAGFIAHNKCILYGWGDCSSACSSGATSYTGTVTYIGTLGVGTVLTSQGACGINTTNFYYYSGGYIEIGVVAGNLQVLSLGDCSTCTFSNLFFDGTSSTCGYYITAIDVNGVTPTLTGGYGVPFCTDGHYYSTTQTGTNQTLNLTIGFFALNGCITVVDSASYVYQQNITGNGPYYFPFLVINNTTPVTIILADNSC